MFYSLCQLACVIRVVLVNLLNNKKRISAAQLCSHKTYPIRLPSRPNLSNIKWREFHEFAGLWWPLNGCKTIHCVTVTRVWMSWGKQTVTSPDPYLPIVVLGLSNGLFIILIIMHYIWASCQFAVFEHFVRAWVTLITGHIIHDYTITLGQLC